MAADEPCRFRPAGDRLRVVLRLTMRCDLACPHCLAAEANGKGEMDTGRWLNVIDQFPSIGAGKVLLTGGEPLLRDDLVALVEACSRAGAISDLNSNLQRMTPTLMRDLRAAGLSEISVAVEGPADTHDRMRGRQGAFARLLQAIEWAHQLDIPVDASCCLVAENRAHIEHLIETAAALPIRSLTFSRLLPIGHGAKVRGALTQEALLACHERIRSQVDAGSPIPVRITGLLGPPRQADCGRGRSLVAIAPDGQLLACALSADNPRVPHPLEAGLRQAWEELRRKLGERPHALCWGNGR